jgi:hypothetical protein
MRIKYTLARERNRIPHIQVGIPNFEPIPPLKSTSAAGNIWFNIPRPKSNLQYQNELLLLGTRHTNGFSWLVVLFLV